MRKITLQVITFTIEKKGLSIICLTIKRKYDPGVQQKKIFVPNHLWIFIESFDSSQEKHAEQEILLNGYPFNPYVKFNNYLQSYINIRVWNNNSTISSNYAWDSVAKTHKKPQTAKKVEIWLLNTVSRETANKINLKTQLAL